MAGEWKEVPFERLLTEPVRNGIYKKKEFHGRGAKVVNMGELFAYPRLRAVPMKRVELSESETDRFLLEAGDLLFARRSLVAEGAGKCSVVLDVNEPTTFESSIIRARPDRSKADSLYLYYFFNSRVGLYHLDTIRRQVAVAGITGGDLAKLELSIPPLPEQRAIAHILGTLDDKIELNRRMNETLEAMARALFKSWFVDFDPVRAKAEGRDPGLPKPLADLFPDSFEDSELGEIPKGWAVATLDALAHIQGGKQLPTEDCKSFGAFPVFGANGIMGYADRATHDGLVIAFGRVGAYCGSVHWTYGGAWINNNASSVVPNHWPEFVLQAMLTADFERMRTGSAQPFIPNSSLASLQVVRPADVVLAAFCAAVRSFRLKEQSLRKDSDNLAALRDALLPKLISGELRVANAEQFMGKTN
jgi:type I restriction enzyme S subunit